MDDNLSDMAYHHGVLHILMSPRTTMVLSKGVDNTLTPISRLLGHIRRYSHLPRR